METQESLKRRIGSILDLQSVVKTMKVMAAAGIRQYEDAVASLARYAETVDHALHILILNGASFTAHGIPSRKRRAISVVFGSDQGMVGQFNDHIAETYRNRAAGNRILQEASI